MFVFYIRDGTDIFSFTFFFHSVLSNLLSYYYCSSSFLVISWLILEAKCKCREICGTKASALLMALFRNQVSPTDAKGFSGG